MDDDFQKVEIKNAEKLGFPHVLEQYLDRFMQEYNQTTSLLIKNYTSVKKCNTQIDFKK